MSTVAVRRSGGANIISIPKTVLELLHLSVGSEMNVSIKDNKIVLTPVTQLLTLETLLKNSPKDKLLMQDEDHEWLDFDNVGDEI